MKSKQTLLLTLLCAFLATTVQCQTLPPATISGTWEGYYGMGQYYSPAHGQVYHWGKDSFFVHMELYQHDRKIVGTFYYSRVGHPDKPIVMYEISGLLDKKNPLTFFRLNKNGVIEDNTDRKLGIQLFHFLEATYRQADSTEILYGNWYPERGNGGVYWVRKTSSSIGPGLQSVLDKKNLAHRE